MIVADGVLHQVDSSAGVHYFYWNYTGYTDWLNVEINIRIKPISAAMAGILFRFSGTDGYCIRYKNVSTVEFGTYNTTSGFSQISETSYARALNVWTNWRVLNKNNRVILLAGDTPYDLDVIFDTTDNTYNNSGKVGLITFSTDADFDDFEVGTCEMLNNAIK